MSDNSVALGQIRHTENGFEGRMKRRFSQGADTVWRMLTEPQGIAQWLAPGSIDLRKGGRAHIDFGDSGVVIDSAVLEIDPPRLLAYSWSSGDQPERPLRWALTEIDEGVELVLTVRLPADEDAAKACAGFEAHLEMLSAALEEVPIRFPFELYLEKRRAYQELLAG